MKNVADLILGRVHPIDHTNEEGLPRWYSYIASSGWDCRVRGNLSLRRDRRRGRFSYSYGKPSNRGAVEVIARCYPSSLLRVGDLDFDHVPNIEYVSAGLEWRKALYNYVCISPRRHQNC